MLKKQYFVIIVTFWYIGYGSYFLENSVSDSSAGKYLNIDHAIASLLFDGLVDRYVDVIAVGLETC